MIDVIAVSARPRLLLVGAGHAHIEVLRRFALERPLDVDPTVLTLEPHHIYSAMVPGYLAGQYGLEEIRVDVLRLAERAGVRCVIGRAIGFDPRARAVALEDGRVLGYDLVSFNIGSLAAGAEHAEAIHAERIKPLGRATRLRERLTALAASRSPDAARIVVIGAGAGGVEVAFAAAALLDRAGRSREVSLVDRARCILPGHGSGFRRRAERVLASRGIHCRLEVGVTAVESDRVLTDPGGPFACDLAIWLTGPEAAPLLAGSGLPTEPRGFLSTDETLRSTGDERVFAVGDCGTMIGHETLAKSGVYAVREAPVLWRNLLATIRGQRLTAYRPQRGFLSILNTCDGRALLHYKALVSWSRWAWRLKDRIDRGFVRRYEGDRAIGR